MPAQRETIKSRIDELYDRFDKRMDDLIHMLRSNDERLRQLEQRESSCHPITQTRMDAAWKRIDKHDIELETITKALHGQNLLLQQLSNISKWAVGILTSIIVALLLAVLSGQAEIVFK